MPDHKKTQNPAVSTDTIADQPKLLGNAFHSTADDEASSAREDDSGEQNDTHEATELADAEAGPVSSAARGDESHAAQPGEGANDAASIEDDADHAQPEEYAHEGQDEEDENDEQDAEHAGGPGDEDHNCTEEFKAAAKVPGEFLARVGDLGAWEHHFRRFSPIKATHSSTLALSARDPMKLRPLVVLKVDGKLVVADGRFMLEQIKAAHPGDPDLQVRVVLFPGSEAEAVAAMCNESFGREPVTKMEMAHGLLGLQRACRISQSALADQYPALTKDKVSLMLIAARLQDGYPVLFELLHEPHKAPISHGVTLNKAVKALPRADFVQLLARAQTLVDDGERCTPDWLYELLGLPQPAAAKPASKPASPVEAAVAEAIFGEDDQPVGAAAPLVNGGEQLFLPAVDAVEQMTPSEREAAANGFIVRILRYFGLEKPG